MAKTYHEAYPEATIRILGSASSIGGVWAFERLYPGLKTNNVIGSYEFSDFPMIPHHYGLEKGQHIPGIAVHKYLNEAAEYFDIARFLRLSTKVVSAARNTGDSWAISYKRLQDSEDTELQQMTANKLVVATSLTSEPFIPYLKGQEQFRGPILHSRQLKAQAAELAAARTVVIIGGNKSAWDVCYSVARSGRQAHMVLRPSGGVPSRVWPLRLWPFNTTLSPLSSTRFFTLFDPWPFDTKSSFGRLRTLLHKWRLGRWITMCFWDVMGIFIRGQNAYSDTANTAKLAPWYSLYWMGNSLSLHNYESSWFELARQGNIKVHIADVVSLSADSIHLSDRTVNSVEALVCCTGWKAEPPIKFTPADVLNTMGIPGSPPLSQELVRKARAHLVSERPSLQAGPARSSVVELSSPDQSTKSAQTGPYRLYWYVVPAHSDLMAARNIAFLGMHLSVHAIMVAQMQALWISAFFEGQIPHLRLDTIDQENVELETTMHVEYEQLRRPRAAGGHGAGFPDLVFDSVPYIDMLLQDLSMQEQRKRGFFNDLFRPYRLSDYRGVVQEWKAKWKSFSTPRN